MITEIFTLCDAASDPQGKLNILGAFNTFNAKKAPLTHPSCAVAVRLRLSLEEKGDHKFSVNFVDSNGKQICPPGEGMFNVSFKDFPTANANLVLLLQNLKLPVYGNYSIKLIIDEKEIADFPFYVNQVKKADVLPSRNTEKE